MTIDQTDKSVLLTTKSGASAEIYFFGATVTSWKVDGKERLFLSSKSSLDASKPIRGGIPIVFPIFGPPPQSPPEYAALKQHGFARTLNWTLESTVMDRDEGVSVRFAAPPPPSSFPHQYKLSYVVTLSRHQLSSDLHITNTGSEDFIFQALFHTYLAVPDATKIRISGLGNGTSYKDKADGIPAGTVSQHDGSDLIIDREIDRVYSSVASHEVEVHDGAGSGLKVRFKGFEDCTVWNPREKAKSMPDMEDQGWNRYVCIEPGYIREFKSLEPGEEFLGQQILSVL